MPIYFRKKGEKSTFLSMFVLGRMTLAILTKFERLTNGAPVDILATAQTYAAVPTQFK